MRHHVAISALVLGLIGGCVGTRLLMTMMPGGSRIAAGTEIVSIQEHELMFVGIRTGLMHFTAQRSRPNAVFSVQITYADDRPPEHCNLPHSFARGLAKLATITARRQSSSPTQALKDFPVKAGSLDLRDRMEETPPVFIALHATSDGTKMAAVVEGAAVEVDIKMSDLDNFQNACHQ